MPARSLSSPPPQDTLQWVQAQIDDRVVFIQPSSVACHRQCIELCPPVTNQSCSDDSRWPTGCSESHVSVALSGPVGPFPAHAWNALGRSDLTSESVAPKIDAWLTLILDG